MDAETQVKFHDSPRLYHYARHWDYLSDIHTNYRMMLNDGNDPMVQLLPQFLALFSSLKKVNFNQQLCVTQRANLRGCKDVFKKILSACPRVKTVLINFSVVDLAFLEVQPCITYHNIWRLRWNRCIPRYSTPRISSLRCLHCLWAVRNILRRCQVSGSSGADS